MDAGKALWEFVDKRAPVSCKMLPYFKHLHLLLPVVVSLLFLPVCAESPPAAPELAYLYTAYVHCTGNLMEPITESPHGFRKAIPIVGGNFTGPRLSGKILDVGADWGLVDPRTGIFSADTRYNFRTDDGEDIFLQTSGPKTESGDLHLRIVMETGSEKYYWVNNIVGWQVMDPLKYPEAVNALVEEGRLAPDAIFNTLTREVKDALAVCRVKEIPELRKNFDSLCTRDEKGKKQLTQSSFITYLQELEYVPESLTKAAAIIYRCLLYLSQTPFHGRRVESLTLDGIVRALAWTSSKRAKFVFEEGKEICSRTGEDIRRLIFQSLATGRDGKKVGFDEDLAKEQAHQRALSLPEAQNYYGVNYDDDGDEMFHDLLDVLYFSQGRLVNQAGVPRDAFRPLAKELCRNEDGGRDLLRHLSIPQDDFRILVKLLVGTQFGRPEAPSEFLSDWDDVTECIVGAFVQDPGIGVTWEMYNRTMDEVPELLCGFHRLFSLLYKADAESDDITLQLPMSGKIATPSVLGQLGMILSNSVEFENIQLYKYYDIQSDATANTTTTLVADMEAVEDLVVILLISGTLGMTGEKVTVGYHYPWYNSSLDKRGSYLLFQLSPIHSIFRGSPSKCQPGWTVHHSGRLVLGTNNKNDSLFVLDEDLKYLRITPGGEDATGMGDQDIGIDVEGIEMLLEVSPSMQDALGLEKEEVHPCPSYI